MRGGGVAWPRCDDSRRPFPMARGRLHRVLLVVAAVGLVSSVAVPPADASTSAGVGIRVGPPASLFDVPLDISAHGLSAGERATLQVASGDGNGITWAGS